MDFVASDFLISPRSVFPLSFPFLFIRFPLSFYPGPSRRFFFSIYPSASLELPPFILPLDYLSICYTTTPRWFLEICSVINYFYVSLAMNMVKILRNLHLNDVLKRHLTFLAFCIKNVSFWPPIGSLINRKEDILLCLGWAQRQRYTVLLIIRAHILPGTREMSDKWIGYNCLQDEGYFHPVVNQSAQSSHGPRHRYPDVEHWKYIVECKTKFASSVRGTSKELFEGYLQEWM